VSIPRFRHAVDSIVALNQPVPRVRVSGSSRTRIVLDAGRQFKVIGHSDYAGSPEYSLLDPTTGDRWSGVPEHCLEAVQDTRPAGLFT